MSRGTLAWTDKASKRQEVSESCARKHQLYKQKGLNSAGQKPPLHGGPAEGFLMSTLLYVKGQKVNTCDVSRNLKSIFTWTTDGESNAHKVAVKGETMSE